MAALRNIVVIALFAVIAVTFVQVHSAAVDQDDIALLSANWTSCDITTSPILSCHDCNTRLICKPYGGLLVTCSNKYRPFCANGVCSPIPTPECA